mgnify:CR=1 FL=1
MNQSGQSLLGAEIGSTYKLSPSGRARICLGPDQQNSSFRSCMSHLGCNQKAAFFPGLEGQDHHLRSVRKDRACQVATISEAENIPIRPLEQSHQLLVPRYCTDDYEPLPASLNTPYCCQGLVFLPVLYPGGTHRRIPLSVIPLRRSLVSR